VIDAGLAQTSNHLLYGSMAAYAAAMYAFAAELAFGRPRKGADAAEPAREKAAVGAGATTTAEPATSPPPSPVDATAPDERSDRMGRIGVSLLVLAFLLHGSSVLARGISAHRPPWGNMFEFSTAGALAVTAVFLVLLGTGRPIRYLGVFVVLPVLLTLGLATTVLYTESAQLVPALRSYWLYIHVTAAIISSGILTIGALQTICYLVQARRERVPAADRAPSFMDRLPSADTLDRAAYRMHAFAFPLWTFAIIAGAIWAENAWGRYWGWDPKETWAFITWVVYAAYLHARSTVGWRGGRAAAIALTGYTCFLFNYLVVNIWLVGFHSYAGVG
jgi:cytochrome c-type biogenesis protein CcsB